MKKIFLSLLALCGMVAGFTLCSCGGGGGGTNLSGTTVVFQGGMGCYLQFDEKLQGTQGSYSATLWNNGGSVNLWLTVEEGPGYTEDGKLNSLRAVVSTTESDWNDTKLFFQIINADVGLDPDVELTEMHLYAPAYMTITPSNNGGGVIGILEWTLKVLSPVFKDEDNQLVDHYEESDTIMPKQYVIGSY